MLLILLEEYASLKILIRPREIYTSPVVLNTPPGGFDMSALSLSVPSALATLGFSILFLLSFSTAGTAHAAKGKTASHAPVNPKASPEAKKLLRFVYEVSGKRLLTAQHNYPGTISHFTNHEYDITGKYPAIWGQDFGFTKDGKDGINHRQAIIDEAKKQYKKGSIITLMWHAVRPVDDEPTGWKESVQNHLTDAEWKELITPGTPLYKHWLSQLDVVAGYLKQLQAAHIPVLWRPYHEGNGKWFWWGYRTGPKGYAALYQNMFNYFTKHHHLNNLIWVWNTNQPGGNAGPYKGFYPGPKFVDILATDVYGNNFLQSHHDDLLKIAAGKPIALGEVGTVPTSAILEKQPRWAWCMIWCDFLDEANTHDGVRDFYNDPRMVTRDELKELYK
jgi:mannan endo-1,4-beta-mannosidase